MIGLAILALGWVCQRKLVDAHWDPAPHRPSPTKTAEVVGSTAPNTGGAAKGAGKANQSKRYPKVLPPEGAPTPPARVE